MMHFSNSFGEPRRKNFVGRANKDSKKAKVRGSKSPSCKIITFPVPQWMYPCNLYSQNGTANSVKLVIT